MNHQYQRRILTPGTARPKLKEREPFNPGKPSPLAPPRPPPPQPPRATVTAVTTGQGGGGAKPMAWNQLLAGYMAHEFLTKGTLLGKRKSVEEAEPRNAVVAKKTKKPNESYNEVTSLLMMIKGGGDGPCIPGVVNPTQLAQWIQM